MEKLNSVYSKVYNKVLVESQAIRSSFYQTYIPKSDAFFCYFDDFYSFVSEHDPRFLCYLQPDNEGNDHAYAKPWYKFGEFGFDLFTNSKDIITILHDDNETIKAIVKFKDNGKFEEFKHSKDQFAFLQAHTTMTYQYLQNIRIDVQNKRIKQFADVYNPYKLSKKELDEIEKEVNSSDFFVII